MRLVAGSVVRQVVHRRGQETGKGRVVPGMDMGRAGQPDFPYSWYGRGAEAMSGPERGNGHATRQPRLWSSKRSAEMTASVLEKWADRVVTAGREPAADIVREFERVLADAVDERPLQTFLASAPMLLGPLAPPGANYWCLDRPQLGAEFVPDFLLASATSAGFRWIAIELESPTVKALTKAGLPARKLADALGQIRDWRTWLTDNVAYARQERGLKDIDGNCEAVVVIGRRSSLDPKQVKRYRAPSSDGIAVMSYDRIHDAMRNSSDLGTINDG